MPILVGSVAFAIDLVLWTVKPLGALTENRKQKTERGGWRRLFELSSVFHLPVQD